jgi:GNAT superfamily N-acetyltransferase
MTEKDIPDSRVLIRRPLEKDMDRINEILNKSVVDSVTGAPIKEEILMISGYLSSFINGESSHRHYVVEEDEFGKVAGIMGITAPDEEMKSFAENPDETLELVNAFVDPLVRGQGVGKKLVLALEQEALLRGATEIVVNSGPRYEKTGHPFWNSTYGNPHVLKDRYGEGRDAMVWHHKITDSQP